MFFYWKQLINDSNDSISQFLMLNIDKILKYYFSFCLIQLNAEMENNWQKHFNKTNVNRLLYSKKRIVCLGSKDITISGIFSVGFNGFSLKSAEIGSWFELSRFITCIQFQCPIVMIFTKYSSNLNEFCFCLLKKIQINQCYFFSRLIVAKSDQKNQ